MQPIDQTLDDNCFQACVASIFEVPIETVPHYTVASKWNWPKFQIWLFKRNWIALEIRLLPDTMSPLSAGCWCILSGRSPRSDDLYHAVVGKTLKLGFEIIHDPHKSRLGVVGEPYWVTFFAWSGHEKCRGL